MQGRTFAVGDSFTAADILIAHTLLWARSAQVTFDSPALVDHVDRMTARPALTRARAREAAA
jgi:glutathione S-transferase